MGRSGRKRKVLGFVLLVDFISTCVLIVFLNRSGQQQARRVDRVCEARISSTGGHPAPFASSCLFAHLIRSFVVALLAASHRQRYVQQQ
jgi:hypothetical protein